MLLAMGNHMTDYVSSALFVYTKDTEYLRPRLIDNACGAAITPVSYDALTQDPQAMLAGVSHVVVSGDLDVTKTILSLAMQYGFSVGLVPGKDQKSLIRFYNLPRDTDAAIDLALQANAPVIDLILCNEKILLSKATIGRIPLLDGRGNIFHLKILIEALKNFFKLELHKFNFKIAGKKDINTAASGCMIIQHHQGSLASRLISSSNLSTVRL